MGMDETTYRMEGEKQNKENVGIQDFMRHHHYDILVANTQGG